VRRDKLSPLQWRVLRALAAMAPPWVLTGGAALAGIYLGHRPTRDLDLFWHDIAQLGDLPHAVSERLRSDGLEVSVIQNAPSFHRLQVSDGDTSCLVDLVADPSPMVDPPREVRVGDMTLTVDSQHEILVNKLCALLSRSEIRDLEDVKALMDSGASLERALADAPRKDGGFSALTLAWVLKELPLATIATASGMPVEHIENLRAFRDSLVDHLTASSAPTE
jgi:hypothetical protein